MTIQPPSFISSAVPYCLQIGTTHADFKQEMEKRTDSW